MFQYFNSRHNIPQKEEKRDNYTARTSYLCSKIHPMPMQRVAHHLDTSFLQYGHNNTSPKLSREYIYAVYTCGSKCS